jgi:hypothetical protein
MNIYIDESGTFVNSNKKGSWSVVSAYMSPETESRKLETILKETKLKSGNTHSDEIKLKNLSENNYFEFLTKVNSLKGVVLCSGTDAFYNTDKIIKEHQDFQVEGILKFIDKMHYESGKSAVNFLSSQIQKLSPQLYIQLQCQVNLIHNIINRAITYFIQRYPNSLRKFKWEIDQKNSGWNNFEDAFEKITPALLQTRSLEDPSLLLRGYDYEKYMKHYIYAEKEKPDYLLEQYGIDIEGSTWNVQKIIRDNISFGDSKKSVGLQIIDLIVSGVRRCLRGEFKNNNKAGILLGHLMMQNFEQKPSVSLLSFDKKAKVDIVANNVVKTMSKYSRNYMKS